MLTLTNIINVVKSDIAMYTTIMPNDQHSTKCNAGTVFLQMLGTGLLLRNTNSRKTYYYLLILRAVSKSSVSRAVKSPLARRARGGILSPLAQFGRIMHPALHYVEGPGYGSEKSNP